MYKPPLKTLIHAAAEMFRVGVRDITGSDISQPVTSYRHLVWLVAREAGYSTGEISRHFAKHATSVHQGSANARERVDRGHAWWTDAKADLVDAWDEAAHGAG